MKMSLTRMAMATAVAVALGSSAFGNTLSITRISGYYGGSGGEFNLTPTDSGPSLLSGYLSAYDASAKVGGGIETFCLETGEYVMPPNGLFYQVSSDAIKGGTTTSDPVSAGTGWLYGLFARGLLGGYGYTYAAGSGRASSAVALQNTIWWLEDAASDPGSGNSFRNAVISYFGTAGNAKATVATMGSLTVDAAYFGVAVLNLGTTSDGNGGAWPNQDQLVWIGAGRTFVPDGGMTVMLLGMALGGVTMLRRKLA
jgi:hypothetical protein